MKEKKEIQVLLPVEPKDVFRLLALRSVVESQQLLKELADSFDSISKGIPTTERLYWDELPRPRKPFGYHHEGYAVKDPLEDLSERELCAGWSAFFSGNYFDNIGKVIDYEIPLDDERDSAYGKIDLLSESSDGQTAYVLEVKKFDSNESPLRALFEVYTFWRMIMAEGSHERFIRLYSVNQGKLKDCTRVVPGVLIHRGSGLYRKLCDTDDSTQLRLLRRFSDEGVRVYVYDEKLNICDESRLLTGKI